MSTNTRGRLMAAFTAAVNDYRAAQPDEDDLRRAGYTDRADLNDSVGVQVTSHDPGPVMTHEQDTATATPEETPRPRPTTRHLNNLLNAVTHSHYDDADVHELQRRWNTPQHQVAPPTPALRLVTN